MKKCKLHVFDEVNCKFEGLPAETRRKIAEQFKIFVPSAIYSPSYKLGRWNGFVNYFYLNGSTYNNLLNDVIPFLIAEGYDDDESIEFIDHRKKWDLDMVDCVDEDYIVDHMPNPYWWKGHPMEGQPIYLRDYQCDVVNSFLSENQCLQEVSTAAGKTLCCATLSHVVEKSGRSIVIVPSKSLVGQTEVYYRHLGLDVGVFYGEKKEFNHTHTISTWQSLHAFVKKYKNQADLKEIRQFFKNVVCLIVDEVHSAKAAVLQELLSGMLADVPLRWGLTGTVPKPKHEFYPLLTSLGPVINHLTAKELQDKGVLAKCNINVMKLEDCGAFRDYHQESEYLNTNKPRIQWISDKIGEIATSGNTLVLIKNIDTGKMMEKLIPGSKFIYGSTKMIDRKSIFDEINDSNNMILIATYGVASVGIDLPRLFNVVMIEPGKSFVRVIQTIGRGIRKARDKGAVTIWDICSTLKYSDVHLDKRMVFYREAQYPYNITEIDWN